MHVDVKMIRGSKLTNNHVSIAAVKECEKQIKENAKIADDRTDEDREIVDFEDRENINTKWPTPTGKTEAQVQKLCEDKIKNSPLGKECARILGDKFNFDNLIKGCKEDIRVRIFEFF